MAREHLDVAAEEGPERSEGFEGGVAEGEGKPVQEPEECVDFAAAVAGAQSRLAGGGMMQLQAILGHSTLDMTRKYINLYGNDIQRDFDRLNPLNNILNKGQDSAKLG